MATVGRPMALSLHTSQSFAQPLDTSELITIVTWIRLIILIVGLFVNLLALYILFRKRSTFNQKYGFILQCLAINDCMLLVCVLVKLCVEMLWLNTVWPMWTCWFHGLAVFFVFNSAGVATMMAVDRWLALTKPFFYREHVSLGLLKRVMIAHWIGIFCLASVPIFASNLYGDKSMCLRYRNAEHMSNRSFTSLFFIYGVFLCAVIIFMNVAVTRALCIRDSHRGNLIIEATQEERKFAKIMLYLSVALFICWIPQMIIIPLDNYTSEKDKMQPFILVADLLTAFHFIVDPYLYVLQHVGKVRLSANTRN